jgi:tetratricopeptide (TPR) repeat protein
MNIRRVLLATTALVAFSVLTGCNYTHGTYTKGELNAAKQRMSSLKAATEWDMGRQAFLGGDLEKAVKAVNRSLALNPNVPKSHVLKGRILAEMGDLEGALVSFAEASKLDEKNADAEYYTGVVNERLSRPDRAYTNYAKAAELDPQNPQYVVAAAEMLIDTNRLNEAEQFLEARKTRFENNAGVRQTLGHIAMMKQDYKLAADLFQEAKLLAPDDAAVVEDLIRAQMSVEKYADAEYNLNKLLKMEANKTRRDLMHMRGRCLVKLDRMLDARDVYIKLTSGSEGTADTEAWIGLGNVSYMLKDNARLKVAAGRVIAMDPSRPDGYTLRALHQRRTADLKGASENLRKALSIRPDAETLLLLAVVQDELNQPNDARESVRQALAIEPNNTTAQHLLGTIGAGRVAGAEEK